jgi:NADPH:quinone reductase
VKAIVMDSYGGPEVLKQKEVAVRQPGAGEVLVEVAAAGVNFMDTGTRRNRPAGLTTLPLIPGVEGAGRVIATGDAVTHLKAGDRVAWYFVWGSYAKQLVAPAAQLVPLPDDMSFETAASLMMQGLTASHFVTDVHAIKAGQVALVHAAAGGVGTILTQIIRILGGSVIGRVSNRAKAAVAAASGATDVIVDREGHFADEVLRLTHGRGVDVVYDGTGAESLADSMRVVDFHGTLALYGPLFDEAMPPIDPWSLPKSIRLVYPVVMHHVRTRDALLERSMQLFGWVRQGALKVHIGQRYPLAEAAQAHRDIESRRTVGKLLLIP